MKNSLKKENNRKNENGKEKELLSTIKLLKDIEKYSALVGAIVLLAIIYIHLPFLFSPDQRPLLKDSVSLVLFVYVFLGRK